MYSNTLHYRYLLRAYIFVSALWSIHCTTETEEAHLNFTTINHFNAQTKPYFEASMMTRTWRRNYNINKQHQQLMHGGGDKKVCAVGLHCLIVHTSSCFMGSHCVQVPLGHAAVWFYWLIVAFSFTCEFIELSTSSSW